MIELLVGLPLFDVGGFEASAYDAAYQQVGEPAFSASGAIYASGVVVPRRRFAFRVFGGLALDTLRYETDTLDFDGTTWEGQLEFGPSWHFGKQGLVSGFVELGLGPHGRLALADYARALGVLGLGGHGAVGVHLGSGPVRGLLAFRTDTTLADATESGDLLLPDGSLSWYWSSISFRAVVCAGVAFGGPAPNAGG